MRIFFSAGEPSGDLHGANLIRTLRQARSDIECVGYGGKQMEAAGCRLLYPLCNLAVVGVHRVLTRAPTFVRLLGDAGRFFDRQRPDAVVLIDYPGFNWWMARRAHGRGIPVFYFVPPQLWAWAGWRVSKMRRYVDHVLCNLPFEEAWYRKRGVDAHYIGHPYFDELAAQKLDASFVAGQQARPGTIIGLLPGSRDQEVEKNLAMLVGAARRIHAARPETRFLVACLRPEQRDYVESRLRGTTVPIETHVGRTAEIIHLAHSCIAVSGSVGLELLHREKPAVVIYGVNQVEMLLSRMLKKVRYISLVNLLADKELYPEYLTEGDESEAIAGHVLHWLSNPAAYQEICAELGILRQSVAVPGACRRAAEYLLNALAPDALAA
jgi:lipid-A-disaccharide synthase